MSIRDEYINCGRRGCTWSGRWSDLKEVPYRGAHSIPFMTQGVCPRCGFKGFDLERPLFIPLCREPFEQFQNGTKPNMEEYRPLGKLWNARRCRIGRKVILSLGYGKQHRLRGKIVGFRILQSSAVPGWKKYYAKQGQVAAIKIELEDEKQRS